MPAAALVVDRLHGREGGLAPAPGSSSWVGRWWTEREGRGSAERAWAEGDGDPYRGELRHWQVPGRDGTSTGFRVSVSVCGTRDDPTPSKQALRLVVRRLREAAGAMLARRARESLQPVFLPYLALDLDEGSAGLPRAGRQACDDATRCQRPLGDLTSPASSRLTGSCTSVASIPDRVTSLWVAGPAEVSMPIRFEATADDGKRAGVDMAEQTEPSTPTALSGSGAPQAFGRVAGGREKHSMEQTETRRVVTEGCRLI